MRSVLPVAAAFVGGFLLAYALLGGRSAEGPLRPTVVSPERQAPTQPDPEIARLQERIAGLEARLAIADPPAGPCASAAAGPIRVTEEITDPETAAVRVLVVDREGVPMGGVRVRVYGGGGAVAPAETGEDGVAILQGQQPGRRIVSAEFNETFRSIEAVLPAGRWTEVRVQEPSGEAAVTGRVLDVTTGPIVGATVGLRCTGVWCDYRRATTAQDGVFRFEGVAPGPAELTCATGLLDRESLSMEISVPTVGTVTQDILTGVLSLQGVVRDSATGLPIRGVNVQLQGGASAQATTDVDGVYRFYDLRPSNPELVFRKDGYGLRIKSSVSIPREGGAEYNVELDPAAALHLLVLDAQDRPFTGQLSIGIKAQRRGTNVAMAINTDDEGRAWFRQIVPGEYDLTFRAVGVGTAKLFARVAPGENSLSVKLQ